MERILVLQLKRIGDLILTLPALDALRSAKPDAHITLVTADAAGALTPVLTQADVVLNYRRGKNNLGLWAKVATGKFDLALDFTGTDRSIALARLSRAKQRTTYTKLAAKNPFRKKLFHELCDAPVRDLHTIDYHLALLASIGIDGEAPEFRIDIPGSHDTSAAAILEKEGAGEKFAVLHPGTAREEKYWPAERWAEVADELRKRGLQVVITGADDERERREIDAIQKATGAPVIDLGGKLTLVELAAVLQRAKIAIGVDTAAMHLAAATRTPQIVLFGPTNPFHWGPRHDRAVVLLAGEDDPYTDWEPRHPAAAMPDLSTSTVIRALDSVLS